MFRCLKLLSMLPGLREGKRAVDQLDYQSPDSIVFEPAGDLVNIYVEDSGQIISNVFSVALKDLAHELICVIQEYVDLVLRLWPEGDMETDKMIKKLADARKWFYETYGENV